MRLNTQTRLKRLKEGALHHYGILNENILTLKRQNKLKIGVSLR